jgi:hypothetical protein
MALPTQIEGRLAALGFQADEVEERFVRGTGPGGQIIKMFKSIPTASLPASELHR